MVGSSTPHLRNQNKGGDSSCFQVFGEQSLPLEHVRQCLPHELFKIQLRKIFFRTFDMRLFIVSYFVKEDLFQLPTPVASEKIRESGNTKLENVATRKELENEESNHSHVEQVTPREELKNELTTEGRLFYQGQQT